MYAGQISRRTLTLEETKQVIDTRATPETAETLAARLTAERPRLVRLCARLSGDPDTAEDLAQEALLEAWRAIARLRDPEGLSPWLAAIARNVCLRWARTRGRDLAHTAYPASTGAADEPTLDDLPAADDLALDIEHGELAALLDRALALLPADTRAALVGSYVLELPQAELAARLELSDGALRVRLHRGRLALRRALATDLRDHALALGLILPEAPDASGWQSTRIWCPFCGRHRIESRIDRSTGSYSYRCAGECLPRGAIVGSTLGSDWLAGLTNAKSILTRHCLMLATSYRQTILRGGDTCSRCGRWYPVQQWGAGDTLPAPPYLHGIYLVCPTCEVDDAATPWHLTLDTPAAQRFWRRHPRMRALPTRAIEFAGRPALVTGFESVAEHAHLALISARDTWEVLRVYGDEQPETDATGRLGQKRDDA
jgi:RNA polymerase sigma factor (sigma-70 family)